MKFDLQLWYASGWSFGAHFYMSCNSDQVLDRLGSDANNRLFAMMYTLGGICRNCCCAWFRISCPLEGERLGLMIEHFKMRSYGYAQQLYTVEYCKHFPRFSNVCVIYAIAQLLGLSHIVRPWIPWCIALDDKCKFGLFQAYAQIDWNKFDLHNLFTWS